MVPQGIRWDNIQPVSKGESARVLAAIRAAEPSQDDDVVNLAVTPPPVRRFRAGHRLDARPTGCGTVT